MKSEISEILIPIPEGRSENSQSNYAVVKAILGCTLIIALGFLFIRYEHKITELEVRLEQLEVISIREEHAKELKEEKRVKREISTEGIPPWVKRSGAGDPFVNKEYLDFLRIQSQQARAGDDDEYSGEDEQLHSTRTSGSRSRSTQVRSGRSGLRRGVVPELVRNDADETFFTRNADGTIVSPSGLREMWERLPPVSSEVTYETSRANLETRAGATQRLGQGQSQGAPRAQLQQVGTGADRVSARVVRYDEDKVSSKVPAIAAHYVADVSNFTSNDNPRLRNSNGIFQIWRPADWMTTEHFSLNRLDGAVTVQKDGIYHIYSQIHYQDEQENSFKVEVNDVPLLQCTTTQQSNSCFTAGLAHLKVNDKIVIKNVGIDRFSIYKPEKSFFGLMRIGNTP